MSDVLEMFLHVLHVLGSLITDPTHRCFLQAVSLLYRGQQSDTHFVEVHILIIGLHDLTDGETEGECREADELVSVLRELLDRQRVAVGTSTHLILEIDARIHKPGTEAVTHLIEVKFPNGIG